MGADMAPVSVIITNHDHGRFVGQAIESALAQTRAGVEVIVVDDGSTDDSRAVIGRYHAVVRPVFQAHGGQAQAMLAGFRASAGEIALFLDGDDLLYPDALAVICSHFRLGVAKVQARLDLIDEHGRRLGRQTPPMAMPSGDLSAIVRRHGWYPAPPTSGNAFARGTLEALLPVPASYACLGTADGRLAVSDHYLSVLGALQGDVVSEARPLGAYRVHPGRTTRQTAALLADARRRIERAAVLSDLVRQRTEPAGIRSRPALELGTPNRVKERLLSLLLDPPGHPVASDARWTLARAGLTAAWSVPWSPLRMRVAQSVGFLALAALPRAAVEPLLSQILVDHGRPRWLSRLLGMQV
jgi:hypothetical protein